MGEDWLVLNEIRRGVRRIPVINAGCGIYSHPTQALGDVLTMRQERGTVSGVDVAIVGDLKRGRTVNSLVKLLANYRAKIRLVGCKHCEVGRDVVKWLISKGVDVKCYEVGDFDGLLKKCNVVYMTRLQKERGSDGEVIKLVPSMLRDSRDGLVIMHPLPRGEELSEEIDSELGAAYFRQMEYCMWVRMSLLSAVMG